jgi:pimeloyl-ACP methyl ester carboxylesterase
MDPPVRRYGKRPFHVVVVHGGPGGAGGMRPVAEGLCRRFGVLEPLQTRTTVDGQIAELKSIITKAADRPVVLIGHSWGAWLAWLTAARHADLVRKLILVGSGGFRPGDGQTAHAVRMERLTEERREEVGSLLSQLEAADEDVARSAFARFGELFAAADAYEWIPHAPVEIDPRPDIYASVWPEAAELRANGQLLNEGRKIRCPVVAFHGDYDSHPIDGVREPLQTLLDDLRLIVLPQCGHEPWFEKRARETFFRSLNEEIAASLTAE